MSNENKFSSKPLVRVDYSFPDVTDEQRSKIYDILHDYKMTPQSGGGGDGSTNSGVKYVLPEEFEAFKQRLIDAGLKYE